jgi:Fur family ferric uptake transcriptional regulator
VHDEMAERFRSENRRMGRARREVVELLATQPGPVTAEGVSELLPDVHPSSVYRTLHVLEELGYVRHVHLAHGPALYELTDRAAKMRHLVCEVCGRTVPIPVRLLEPLQRRLERDYDFVLDSGHFALVGRCVACARPRTER